MLDLQIKSRRDAMMRKLIIALAATVALGGGAFVASDASAAPVNAAAINAAAMASGSVQPAWWGGWHRHHHVRYHHPIFRRHHLWLQVPRDCLRAAAMHAS